MVESNTSQFPYQANGKKYLGSFVDVPGGKPLAGMVLLPDWRGQSSLARDHALFLVEQGCATVIADLYGDGFSPTDPAQVSTMVQRLMENRSSGVAALDACVQALRSRLGNETPLFCLGYSAGGMVALDYGRSGAALAGIIVCTGLLKTAADGASPRIEAPVLLLQGTQDQVSSMQIVAALVAEMDGAGNDFRLELYGQTHHAFDNPEAGSDPKARLVYSPAAAAQARSAIAEFIREHASR